MSEEFHDLLEKSLSSTIQQEERQQVTNALLEIYQSPQSTIEIIQFLLNEQSIIIRKAASIGFKKSLSNNWAVISQSELHEPVKEALINIFRNEKDKQIRHTLVQASMPIFESDADEWTSLFELVTNLTNDRTKHNEIEFSMYLISYFAPCLSTANIEANFQFFLDLCNFSFETQNTELIDTACGLVAVLIKLIGAEDMQIMEASFSKMLEIYLYALSISNNQSFKNNAVSITNKVAFAFEIDYYPLPYEQILTKLYEAVQYDPILAFNPINEFIKTCGKKLTNSYDEIIVQTFTIATSLFVDGSLEDNENAMYVLLAIEKLSKCAKPRVFFPKLLKMLPTNTPQETIISAMILSRVVQTSKEAIIKNISQLSKLIFGTLQIDHICAKEVALDIIKEIAKLFEEGKSDISSQFMKPIIELLDCDHPDLIKHALSAFKELLKCTDIDTNLIGPVLQTLSKLLNSSNVSTAHVLDVISALVFSAGDDVAPFVEVLYPLIIQTASISEDEDPNLKANSIEALSNILRFSSLSDELINQSLSLIVRSGQTSDYDIRGSVMSSLSNLLVNKLPQVVNFAGPIQELISVYISEEIKSDMDDNDEDVEIQFTSSQNQINSLTNTFLLIKNIYKRCPQLAPEDHSQWFQFSVSYMISIADDLSYAATLASIYMLLTVSANLDPSEFLKNLIDNFDNDSATVASCSFKAMTRFLENDIPIPGEVIVKAVEKGKLALGGKLECQDEDAEPSDISILTLSVQVNKFFAELVTKIPAAFPINDYIDYEKHIGGNSDEFEISQCIGVLRQLYINSGDGCQINLSSIQKKLIIKAFFSTLQICDFTVLPEPLIALKYVLIKDSDKIIPRLQEVLGFIGNLFNCENEGEMHYWSTMTNAVSFLCTLLRMNLESFELGSWLPRILAVLPVKGDEMEAENIYGTLLWLIRSTPIGSEVVKNFGPELIRVFAQTFGLKDKVFMLFKLSTETKQGMAQILLDLIKNAEGASELFEQSFQGDTDSQVRCQEHLQSLQQP